MTHILHVVGARPNFVKAAPVLRALAAKKGVRQTLVGDIADAQTDDLCGGVRGAECGDSAANLGEEVASFELEIVFVDASHAEEPSCCCV